MFVLVRGGGTVKSMAFLVRVLGAAVVVAMLVVCVLAIIFCLHREQTGGQPPRFDGTSQHQKPTSVASADGQGGRRADGGQEKSRWLGEVSNKEAQTLSLRTVAVSRSMTTARRNDVAGFLGEVVDGSSRRFDGQSELLHVRLRVASVLFGTGLRIGDALEVQFLRRTDEFMALRDDGITEDDAVDEQLVLERGVLLLVIVQPQNSGWLVVYRERVPSVESDRVALLMLMREAGPRELGWEPLWQKVILAGNGLSVGRAVSALMTLASWEQRVAVLSSTLLRDDLPERSRRHVSSALISTVEDRHCAVYASAMAQFRMILGGAKSGDRARLKDVEGRLERSRCREAVFPSEVGKRRPNATPR